MDKDDIKKATKFVRLVSFLVGCVLCGKLAFIFFEYFKGEFYSKYGLMGVIILGIVLVYCAFERCEDLYHKKRLEEEIEKEEEE